MNRAYDLITPALLRVLFGPSLSTGFGWLAMTAIACLHLRYPFTAVLGGVRGPVPRYRLLSHARPGIGWSVRSRWDRQSQVHLLGGNRTRTVIELSGTEAPATDTRIVEECGCQSTDRTKSTTQQPRT